MDEDIEFSEWQTGHPPHDGVWQILSKDFIYYAQYKGGLWGAGTHTADEAKRSPFKPYRPNNENPTPWRGRLVDTSQQVGHNQIKKEL